MWTKVPTVSAKHRTIRHKRMMDQFFLFIETPSFFQYTINSAVGQERKFYNELSVFKEAAEEVSILLERL